MPRSSLKRWGARALPDSTAVTLANFLGLPQALLFPEDS
jgi:hypothetical protein